MKARSLAGAAVLALSAGLPAQDLKFPVGEGAFNWDSYKAYDEATNLDGQTLKIFGPWRGEDQVLVENMLAYFTAATGVKVEVFVVRKLRTADRHRHPGRLARPTSPSCRSPA
jgi:alpha-glucoside transport system substrate-binding protein